MGRHMNTVEQTEIWDRYEAGQTFTEIAASVGRPLSTVRDYVARHGFRRPVGPPAWSSARMSLMDREEISRGLVAGESLRSIARRLDRAPSTICREVNTNGGRGAYRAVDAEDRVRERAKRPKVPKLAANSRLRILVESKLAVRWSPEQISGWLRTQYPTDPSMWVCHETIYRSVYAHHRGVLRKELWRCLRTRRAARTPRTGHRRGRGQGVIRDPVLISARPGVVETREEAGHWEGDLLVGNRVTAVATLVEPKTRYLILAALPGSRTAEALNNAIAAQLEAFPPTLRRTLTWDQGKETAGHKTLREKAGIEVYLCDPYSPWQRGTNENTNGLLRQYFPKSTNFYKLDQRAYDQVAAELNNRPRQILGWQTPHQALTAVTKQTS